jgi:hypothetical protein
LVMMRPKPEEAPVIIHVFAIVLPFMPPDCGCS